MSPSLISALACAVIGFLGASVGAESPGPWAWKVSEGKSLSLTREGKVVWALEHGADLAHFYFDPVRVGDQEFTWVAPPDHPWHLGVWFSWKHINGVNYWEIPRGATHPVGRTSIGKVEVLQTSETGCRVRILQSLHPSAEADPIARETVLLEVETPRADGSFAINWRHQTHALADLEFESPRGYGGLSFRADRHWEDARFLTPQGESKVGDEQNLFVEPASPWMHVMAKRDGNDLGVALFDHPTNPRHPNQWFLVKDLLGSDPSDKWPFYYANPALMAGEPLKLARSGTLDLFYRLYFHTGTRDRGAIESEASVFSALDRPQP